jgi:hypothetical protein
MNKIIEVTIKKMRANYQATCDMFPGIKGVGKTKDAAVDKLSLAISTDAAKKIRVLTRQLFGSKSYSSVIFDQSGDADQEVRCFTFPGNDAAESHSRNVYIKYPNLVFSGDVVENGPCVHADESVLSEDRYSLDDMFDIRSYIHKHSVESDSIIFGFPLNFN